MEKALYEIQHRLNMDLLMEYNAISTSLKRKILINRILAFSSLLLAALLFLIDDIMWGCIYVAFFILMITYPSRKKKAIQKFYLKNENLLKDRTLYLFDDYLEVKTVSEDTKVEYAKIIKSIETKNGLYLYLDKATALCFPISAFTPAALDFLRTKAHVE